MINIDEDLFLELLERFDDTDCILDNYIPSEKDMERIKNDLEKYMFFINYLLNVDREKNAEQDNINFTEEEKERLDDINKRLNLIVDNNLKLVRKD